MMTKEEFSRTNWKMSYEQYQKCYCPECSKKVASTEMLTEEFHRLMAASLSALS